MRKTRAEVSKHPIADITLQAVELHYVLHRSQPRELALRKLARRCDGLFAQRRESNVAVQIIPDLPVADAAHRWHRRVQRILGAQAPQFADEAELEHQFKALRNSLVKLGALCRNQRHLDWHIRKVDVFRL